MQEITNALFAMQDTGYRDFQARLVPTIPKETIIGVRTPMLRQYAKQIKNTPLAAEFLKELPHRYYEENNLHAFLVSEQAKDFDATIKEIEAFLPYIDNWATCDGFTPKIFKKYPDRTYEKVQQWLQSPRTYTVRFAVVTLLQFFLDEQFRPEILTRLSQIHTGEYYINMAIAWFYSFALIKQYEATIGLFEQQTLDPWVHNKSIQKAVESYRIPPETKQYLKSLKR